jgi:hypothetical protein
MSLLQHILEIGGGMVAAWVLPAMWRVAKARRLPIEVFKERVLPSPADDRWGWVGGQYERFSCGGIHVNKCGQIVIDGIVVVPTCRRARLYWKRIEHHFDRRLLDRALEAIP